MGSWVGLTAAVLAVVWTLSTLAVGYFAMGWALFSRQMFTAIAAVQAWWLWYGYSVSRQLPSFKGPPVYNLFSGHLPEIINEGYAAFYRRCQQQYGNLFRIVLGQRAHVIVCDPVLVSKICNSEFSVYDGRDDPFSGSTSLILIRGAPWHRIRSALQPAFTSDQTKASTHHFITCTDRLIDRMKAIATPPLSPGGNFVLSPRSGDAGKEPVKKLLDLPTVLSAMTMDCIGSAAFGTNFECQRGDAAASAAADAAASASAASAATGNNSAATKSAGGAVTTPNVHPIARIAKGFFDSLRLDTHAGMQIAWAFPFILRAFM